MKVFSRIHSLFFSVSNKIFLAINTHTLVRSFWDLKQEQTRGNVSYFFSFFFFSFSQNRYMRGGRRAFWIEETGDDHDIDYIKEN